MARPSGGDDPTRKNPGGSRTETRITEESELGSDVSGDDALAYNGRTNLQEQRRTSPEERPRARRTDNR